MSVVVRRPLRAVRSPLAMLTFSAALLVAVSGLPARAVAQSFFEQIFGLAAKPLLSAATASRPMSPAMGFPTGRPYSSMSRPDHEPGEGRGSSERHTGNYRTVCVRLCDGAFFPINQSSARGYMHADADVCRSRCGATESRLFYYPNSSELKEAVDLAGRSYRSLPTAFLFRKKLVDGCACKPTPWSEAEADRHRRYAMAEGRTPPALAQGRGSPIVVAGNYSEARQPTSAPSVTAEATDATEIDGIPVVNVPALAPPVPQMARSDSEPSERPAPRKVRREQAEARQEIKSRPELKPEPRQAGKPQKPAVAALPSAQPGPRRAAPAASTAILFGSPSGGKFAWPGDGPSKYR